MLVKKISIEFEIFRALFSFLEGFLSQYLVLKINLIYLKEVYVIPLVRKEVCLFARCLVTFSGQEPAKYPNFLLHFLPISPLGELV